MLSEAVSEVEQAIRSLKKKFLEAPFSFYSEPDMHCYLYSVLYQVGFLKEEAVVGLNNGEVIKTLRQFELCKYDIKSFLKKVHQFKYVLNYRYKKKCKLA